jgi:acyl-CoA synthetase (AMP-forming)/AMP-acid ligase II
MTGISRVARLSERVSDEAWALGQLARTGALGYIAPGALVGIVGALRRYGILGAAVSIAAIRFPQRVALVDERGSLTFGELDSRSNAVANHWRRDGLRAGDGVAILARNHRGFLDSAFAAAKCGARIILLNTDFGGAQVCEAVEREGADLLVHDDEYSGLIGAVDLRLRRWRAWTDEPAADTLEAIIAGGETSAPPAPGVETKIVILTSGTTGTPKGAARSEPRSLLPVGGLLSRAPFRARGVTECCAPLFHALGFAHAVLAVVLGSTLVVRRRFDAALTLDSLAAHRATAMIVVPMMLQRMLDLGTGSRASADLSRLRIIFVAGSQLGAGLCTRATAAFGPVIHNLYGSTEVAYATIATPQDLAIEPGCVGRVVRGAIVKVLDDADREAPAGTTGRIFVANSMQFDGYTGGGTKPSVGGLMATGDVGHFDRAGRLFIDGRDDDMIVSGGENVFPAEVEEALADHPDIVEAAVIGVPDDAYGQRLRCFIVARDGATLGEQDVKEYVRHRLSRFKVPRDIRFVEALPRNPTGKILKRALEGEAMS